MNKNSVENALLFSAQQKKTSHPSKMREFLIDNEYLSDVKITLENQDSNETVSGE